MALALDHQRVSTRPPATDGRQSRRRLLEADEERRQIARDLHDGLQTQLVLLAMEADRAWADLPPSAAAREALAHLRDGLRRAIADLRALVHDVMPAVLAERGLCAAIEELAARAPAAVILELAEPEGRLAPPVESTGYFVVSEALSNALKHSGASELRLAVAQAGDRLRIEVRDNGMGGAHSAGGIQGMGDRVAALGGRLLIDSPARGGTRVVVEIPCAW